MPSISSIVISMYVTEDDGYSSLVSDPLYDIENVSLYSSDNKRLIVANG